MLCPKPDLKVYQERLKTIDPIQTWGRVSRLVGFTLESQGPPAEVGEICLLTSAAGGYTQAEVVGFRDRHLLLMPIGDLAGIAPGTRVVSTGMPLTVRVGPELKGRVLDGLGYPMDEGPPLTGGTTYSLKAQAPHPLRRQRITEPLELGIKVVDGLLTCGKGQRLGIFAGSGVGKSTMLGMIAKNTAADINVVALIGERGREVREFLEESLGSEGLARTVLVVATSDQPPLIRVKGAFVALSIAEYFRDQGLDVLFMMDSITRFAMAQREIGLATGEPPTTKGYTPSVFALLPQLLERAGAAEYGTITGLFTVLVDGDDLMDPIADATRSILDGHIVLTRRLASLNHYPAVDVLQSVSRVMPDVVKESQLQLSQKAREVLAVYQEAEDLINVGAYVAGSNPSIDRARSLIGPLRTFLKQDVNETFSMAETRHLLAQALGETGEE
ncbi:MAG TPA: FliI/YscN family ATPase [Firmicutes bacterium]|nr:FliI/YscN family ATPase [Bacillota bacterium]